MTEYRIEYQIDDADTWLELIVRNELPIRIKEVIIFNNSTSDQDFVEFGISDRQNATLQEGQADITETKTPSKYLGKKFVNKQDFCRYDDLANLFISRSDSLYVKTGTARKFIVHLCYVGAYQNVTNANVSTPTSNNNTATTTTTRSGGGY